MTAGTALLDRLVGLGFDVALGAHDALIVRPASKLTDELRHAIREHRAGMVAGLLDPDPRVTCSRCAHYRPDAHRCANFRMARLSSSDIAPELANLKQHCPGHLLG